MDIVLQQKFHTLNSRTVEVKRAEPKDKNKGYICTYNCHDPRHHFKRVSVSSSSGLHHDFVTSYNISPSSILPPGSLRGTTMEQVILLDLVMELAMRRSQGLVPVVLIGTQYHMKIPFSIHHISG